MPNNDNDNDNDYLEAVRKLRDWRERLAARPEHNWNVDLLTHAPDEPFHYGSTVTLSAAQFGALLAMQGTLRDAFDRGYRAGQYGTVPADPAGTARRVVEVLLGSDEGIHDAADAVTALQAWRDEAVRGAIREALRQQRVQVLAELADELLDRRERQALSTPLTDTDELVAAVSEHYHGMHADNLTAARVAVESDVCRSVAATLQITPPTWRGRRVGRADLIALLRAVPNARGSERSLIAIELDIEQPGDDDNLTRAELVDRIRNTRPAGGQAVCEARAAERANILGQLGININPTAAPGTQGAVRQIRNWADAQAETVERNTRANTLGALLTPPAVRRYAELRRRYSAEHDAHEHGTGHFTAAVFALLLNDDQRLTDVQVWADGSESFTCRAPAHLWPFANSPAGRVAAAGRAREKPRAWRLAEAAALLMCAADRGNEETTDA